jgi:hypothetical protein
MSLVWQCETALSFEAAQRPAMVKSSETTVNESCRPSLEAIAVILPLVIMSIYSKAFAAPAMNFEGKGCEPSRLPWPVPHGCLNPRAHEPTCKCQRAHAHTRGKFFFKREGRGE